MGNNTRTGNSTHNALNELKNAGFTNLRIYQLENGAINVGGEKTTTDGQIITDYRRIYTPRNNGVSRTAHRTYQRILSEYNGFKASNRDVCEKSSLPSKHGTDFVENQTMAAIIAVLAMAVIGFVMVVFGNAKI